MQNSNVTMSQCLISGQRSTLLESQLHWKRGCCSQLLHRTQAVTRVSITWNASLNIWSLTPNLFLKEAKDNFAQGCCPKLLQHLQPNCHPCVPQEEINTTRLVLGLSLCCINANMGEWGNQLLQLLWSARMFYYNVYALVPAAVKGCCPRAPAVSLLLLLSLRRSPGPTLSPVCKDASPMSTVIAGPYWFCHCHQRWNLYLGELWLSYCQCDSFPKHLTWLLRYAVTKWKPLIRTRGWIQLRPRVWIQIRVLCRCGVIAPCLLLLLLVVEGIFKWNPGKCAKSHHAILHTVTIPNRLWPIANTK